MQTSRTVPTGRRRAATIAGSVIVAMGATAISALPAAADAPVTSLAPAVPAAFGAGTSTDGWYFAGGVDFGTQDGALRLSNATTSGVIQQLVTPQLDASAGEPGSGGTFDEFDAQFTVASQTGALQPGLKIEVAPDNGSGSRTGGSFTLWHNPVTEKLEIGAIWAKPNGDTNSESGWTSKTLAAVDPSVAHTVAISEHFVTGGGDVADVSVDGAFVGRVGTYEKYATDAGDPLGTIDSLIFRASTSVPNGGDGWGQQPAVAANEGHGFLVSDIAYSVGDAQSRDVAPLAPAVQPNVSSLGFFQDATDTRTKGHNELTAAGLHVWTEDSSSDSKAALYHVLDQAIPLGQIGEPAITLADGATGVRPALQLGVDRDGDGHWDGYLVSEPDAYGPGIWWTNKQYFGVTGGWGYPSAGTLDQYLTANPHAQVVSVGYSLGSGVQGDATITSLTFGGKTYPLHALYPASIAATVTKGGYGQAGTVDLEVAARSAQGDVLATVPTGTVRVSEGAFSATATLVAGKATVTLPANLAVGKHVLAISYAGDADVAAATTQVGVGVPLASSFLLTPGFAEQVAGTHGLLPVLVLPDGATGTVTVKAGSTVLGSAPVVDGEADVDLKPGLAVGQYTLTVAYSGDATFGASTTSAVLFVEKSTASVSASWSKAHYGTAATVAVKVSGAAGAASGTVSVVEGTKTLATKALAGGKATLALPKSLKVGTHKLTLRYSGSATVEAKSVSKSLTVAKASAKASVKLSSSQVKPNKHAKATVVVSAAGVTVNGKATVTVTSASGHKVTVKATVENGKAKVTLPSLGTGRYTVKVTFAGTSKVASATSKTVKLTVAW